MQTRYIKVILNEEAARQFNQNYDDCPIFKYDKFDISYRKLGNTKLMEVYDVSTKEILFVINMDYVISIDFCFYIFVEDCEYA